MTRNGFSLFAFAGKIKIRSYEKGKYRQDNRCVKHNLQNYWKGNVLAQIQIDLSSMPPRDAHDLLSSAVIPRPIAWVSSVSADGQVNDFFKYVLSFRTPLSVAGTSTNKCLSPIEIH